MAAALSSAGPAGDDDELLEFLSPVIWQSVVDRVSTLLLSSSQLASYSDAQRVHVTDSINALLTLLRTQLPTFIAYLSKFNTRLADFYCDSSADSHAFHTALSSFLSRSMSDAQLALLASHLTHIQQCIVAEILAQVGYPIHPADGLLICPSHSYLSTISLIHSVLYRAYPKLATHGYEGATPVIYYTANSPIVPYLETVSFHLNLTHDSFRLVTTHAALGSPTAATLILTPTTLPVHPLVCQAIDIAALESHILADEQAGRVPLLLMATLGSSASTTHYQYDDVVALHKLTQQYDMWLHVEGTTLCWPDAQFEQRRVRNKPIEPAATPANTRTARRTPRPAAATTESELALTSSIYDHVDSATVRFADYVDLPALSPYTATFVRNPKELPRSLRGYTTATTLYSVTPDAFYSMLLNVLDITSLTNYSTLLFEAGHAQLARVNYVKTALNSQGFRVVLAPLGEVSESNRPVNAPPVPSHPHIFFQIDTPSHLPLSMFNVTLNQLNDNLQAQVYARADDPVLSRILGVVLHSAHLNGVSGFTYTPRIQIDAAIEQQGLNRFMAIIADELQLFHAIARERAEFEQLVSNDPELILIPSSQLDDFYDPVGLGAVRFQPQSLPEDLLDHVGYSLNEALFKLDSSLVSLAPNALFTSQLLLSSSASIYRSARTKQGNVCTVIALHAVTARLSAREIFTQISRTARKLKLPDKVVDDLSKALKQGIQEAERKLAQSHEEPIRPTQIIRMLPVVGSVFNYFAPAELQENGQSYDIRSKELSTIKYSYANDEAEEGEQFDEQHQLSPAPASTAASTTAPASTSVSAAPSKSTPVLSSVSPSTSAFSSPASSTTTLFPVVASPFTTSAPASTSSGVLGNSPGSSMFSSAALANKPATTPSVAAAVSIPPASASPATSAPTRSTSLITTDAEDADILNDFSDPTRAQVIADGVRLAERGETFTAHIPPELTSPSSASASTRRRRRDVESDQSRAASPTRKTVRVWYTPQPALIAKSADAAPESTGRRRRAAANGSDTGYTPGKCLCWSYHGDKVVRAGHYASLQSVVNFHLGKNTEFPVSSHTATDAKRERCLSVKFADGAQLFLEAASATIAEDFFLGFAHILQQEYSNVQTSAVSTTAATSYNLTGATASTGVNVDAALAVSSVSSGAAAKQSLGGEQKPNMASATTDEEEVEQDELVSSLNFLSTGSPFVVYVLDKNDPELTSRHEVVLWYKPAAVVAASAGVPVDDDGRGFLCWCRRGPTLDFSPSRSLPLNSTVQICMGKQTKAFKNAAAAAADPSSCFSIMVDKMILNLEASSHEARAEWLQHFHAVMTSSGKDKVDEVR